LDHLAIRPELVRLADAAAWAAAVAARLNLNSSVSFAIQLCLEEAVSNVIRHAFPADADAAARNSDIMLALGPRGDAIALTIADRGAAFNPLTFAEPAAHPSLDTVVIGGQGIHLMRKFAQTIHYERCGEMNRLTLLFGTKTPAT
jgi:anti-sigma regulatory factor (Ser/Thr protein kinase)